MSSSKPISMTSTQAHNTLPDELRNALYSQLLSGNGIRNIEGNLTHEMQATGFMANLKGYITHLYRSGQCTTHSEAMTLVTEKIRHDTQAKKSNGVTNGVNGINGHSKENDEYDLSLPDRVIREGVKTVRMELNEVCDITYPDDK
ncbi:hypothetical protein BU26DRAFT_252618 [Trematosphaeria pertusa]|uniref:Uncharacterized protein n=1 Tax=Trematosphaeria pertusa TaxID=390896 RepID=A0A6A6IQW3_9PLEO|nr:uncharacterized protein BU26DRAFT_252618 [Trematosphaeria pertusa]KAF2252182.1 hypothetical protein BU26DRAFT_252618 [Trematosphaeria pertusa]